MGGSDGVSRGEIHDPGIVNKMFNVGSFTAAEDHLRQEKDPQRPKAFLNYLLFSEEGVLIPEGSGRMQADGDGSGSRGDVYFDLLEVRLTKGQLREEKQYFDKLNTSFIHLGCRWVIWQ